MKVIMGGVSEWLNLVAFLGTAERGPYSPYKPINDSLYIGIIIYISLNYS